MTMFSCWLSISLQALVVLKTQLLEATNPRVSMSDTAPVSVGDTATFNSTYYCTDCPVGPQKVTWYPLRQNDTSLVLYQGSGTSCLAWTSIPTYTFRHICDGEKRQYTLSIVDVTQSDIDINYEWCCYFSPSPDLRTCARITDAAKTTSLSPTTDDRTETTESTTNGTTHAVKSTSISPTTDDRTEVTDSTTTETSEAITSTTISPTTEVGTEVSRTTTVTESTTMGTSRGTLPEPPSQLLIGMLAVFVLSASI